MGTRARIQFVHILYIVLYKQHGLLANKSEITANTLMAKNEMISIYYMLTRSSSMQEL
jgi:hypothetical protein